MKMLFLSVTMFVLALCFEQIASKALVCYWGTWAVYRPGRGKFEVNHIDPNLCTHLIYSFFGIGEDGSFKVLDPYLDLEDNYGKGNIKKFNKLKKINPRLKTLAAIGGWNEGSRKYSLVAGDPAKRKKFAREAKEFVLKYGFDGLDLDWEYPAQRDGNSQADKENFIRFISEIKTQFASAGLMLTAAVGATEFSASMSYDIPQMSNILDHIHLMTYDFHGSWDHKLGLNAPLHKGIADQTPTEKQLNLEDAVNYWLHSGASKEKLILGMPLYGHTFTMQNPQNNRPGAPINGPGQAGPYTRQAGILGYNEICVNQNRWKRVWEPQQMAPYAIQGNQWLSYDDVQSIGYKVDFVNSKGLGGAMVWSIETDDFQNDCGQGKYPLLHKIKGGLRSKYIQKTSWGLMTRWNQTASMSIWKFNEKFADYTLLFYKNPK